MHLDEELIFPPEEEWVVGLQEIFYPTTVFTFNDNNTRKFLIEKHIWYRNEDGEAVASDSTHAVRLSQGSFSPAKFVEMTKKKIGKLEAVLETNDGRPKRITHSIDSFFYLTDENKIVLQKEAYERFIIHPSLLSMLGCNLDQDRQQMADLMRYHTKREKIKFSNPASFDLHFQKMYVYLDIIKYTQISDTSAPILRVVHFSKVIQKLMKHENQYSSEHEEFRHVEYFPMARQRIQQISVQLLDSIGHPIKFYGGKTCLVIKFVKKNSPLKRSLR